VGQLTGTLLSIGAGINTAIRVSTQLVLPSASIEVGLSASTAEGAANAAYARESILQAGLFEPSILVCQELDIIRQRFFALLVRMF